MKKDIERVLIWIIQSTMGRKSKKKIAFKRPRFQSRYSIKARTFFAFSLPLKKHYFRTKILQSLRISFWRSFTKSPIFCLKTLQGIRFWNKTFTTFQILNLKKWKNSEVEKNAFKYSRLEFFYIVKTTYFQFFVFLRKAWP